MRSAPPPRRSILRRARQETHHAAAQAPPRRRELPSKPAHAPLAFVGFDLTAMLGFESRYRIDPTTLQRSTQPGQDRPALGWIGDRLADADSALLLIEGHLIAWANPDPVADRLWNHHLTLGPHLVSHTLSITSWGRRHEAAEAGHGGSAHARPVSVGRRADDLQAKPESVVDRLDVAVRSV